MRERHTGAGTSPEGPSHSPSGSYTHNSSSLGIGTKASMPLSKASQQHQQVPSSSTHAVILEAYLAEQLHHHRLDRGRQRYPTPPWWLPGGLETDGDLLVRGATRHSSPSVLQRRAGDDDLTPHTMQAERGLGVEHRLPSPSTPAPPPPRLRARSARKGCPPRPRSPSVRLQAHLSTSSNKLQEADGGASPLPFVDPGAYRLGNAEAQSSRTGLGFRGACAPAHRLGRQSSQYSLLHGIFPTFPSADSMRPRGTLCGISSSTEAAPDSDTEAISGRTALSNVLATTAVSTCRLRVYQESVNHPSGFAVPRRGAGTAAPVEANWDGLAALPQTVADRHAIECAVNAVPGSLIYGASNHASASALAAYRQGVAAETGIDPVQLRHGPLSACYDRVRGGWRGPIVQRVDGGSGGGGASLTHTTTRVRVGVSRPSELYDPISGLPRKPNEVPAVYLQSIAAEAARGHFCTAPSVQGEVGRVVSYRHGDGGPHASMDAPADFSSAPTRRQTRSGAFAWADKLSGLAQQRRARATVRSAQLHSTHRITGLPLRPDERRLYWAEHAPLHTTSVRGLNAVLQGVGEAEEGLLVEGVGSRSSWAKRGGTGRGAPWAGANVVVCAEEETEVTLDHWCASTDESCGDNDGDDNNNEAWPAVAVERPRRRGSGGRGEFQTESAPLHHSRLPTRASEHSAFSYANSAVAAACARGSRRGAADASRVHVEGKNGLVDSHVYEDVTTDVENGARTRRPDHDGLSHHRTESGHRAGTPPMEQSRRTSPSRRSLSHDHPERNHHDEEDLLLYPPLLTPLLQEVDMRLRAHQLPSMAELWRWGVGDQEAILQIAGFRRAERQAILWELERMIRVSSTRCALSAAA